MTTYSDLPENFQAGRVKMVLDYPYLASVAYRLFPVAKPGLGTMAVDAWYRLYFDPTCQWTPAQISTVLYHEIGHLLRNHHERASVQPGINFTAWNLCADAEINDDIGDGGLEKWPFPPIFPKNLKQNDGLLAEEYYANLPKVDIKVTGPGAGKCGSCSGNPIEGEESEPTGQKDDTPGVSGIEKELIARKVATDVKEHCKDRGTAPAWLTRWAEEILNPRVNWRKILPGLVRHCLADVAGMVDFSYRRPSRRQMPNVILPSLRRPVPQIAIVIDTSGSMSPDNLTSVLGEVKGILRQAGCGDVDTIVGDAEFTGKRINQVSQVTLKGGGGTDMRVGIEMAYKRMPRPHVIIVLTDGYTPWPDKPIGARIVAGIVGTGAKSISVPLWIKRVNIDD